MSLPFDSSSMTTDEKDNSIDFSTSLSRLDQTRDIFLSQNRKIRYLPPPYYLVVSLLKGNVNCIVRSGRNK